MTQEEPLRTLKSRTLCQLYESACNEYRRRLCVMWDIYFDESWWRGDHIGGELFLADWWMPLDMDELRYCVENDVTWEAWLEYCAFCEEAYKGHDHPSINFYSWFKLGCRPEMLKD